MGNHIGETGSNIAISHGGGKIQGVRYYDLTLFCFCMGSFGKSYERWLGPGDLDENDHGAKGR
jgi:hypothetical protein